MQLMIAPAPFSALRQRMRRLMRPALLGTLRRGTPLSGCWGIDRGTPIDRHYIEQFMAEYHRDIRGAVLELQDGTYVDRFGAGVMRRDILDINTANPRATVIADLNVADSLPPERYDCFILTQTLQYIYEVRIGLANARSTLRNGGILLATVPSITRVDAGLADVDYWRFTAAVCTKLFVEVFGDRHVTVRARGNVLTGMAFLTGMAAEELSARELAVNDANFPLIICIRAVKC